MGQRQLGHCLITGVVTQGLLRQNYLIGGQEGSLFSYSYDRERIFGRRYRPLSHCSCNSKGINFLTRMMLLSLANKGLKL